MHSDSAACTQIASMMKARIPWLNMIDAHEDGQGGLIVTIYGDRRHVMEVLGVEDLFITFAAVIRVDLVFAKCKKPPDVKVLYSLSPRILLINPDRDNTWHDTHLATHIGIDQYVLDEMLSPSHMVFKHSSLKWIATRYASHLLAVEENLAALILAAHLSRG